MDQEPVEKKDLYKTSKFDLILICLILLLSITGIIYFGRARFQHSTGKNTVLIYQQEKLLESVPLDKNTFIDLLDKRMQVEIKDGRVRMDRSDCPQHICVNTGWIQYSGQTIVCVPNKIIVEIKSPEAPLVDAVSNYDSMKKMSPDYTDYEERLHRFFLQC